MGQITMPQLGETVTEGTITRWLKQVGDQIERDELLFEVSTDKVDSEVPSSEAGVLTAILVAEGETVAVGTPLAVIGDAAAVPGAAPAEAAPPATAPVPAAPVPAAPPEPEPEPAPMADVAPQPRPAPQPPPPPPPAPPVQEPASAREQTASAPVYVASPPAPSSAEAPAGQVDRPDGMVLSPVVRRLIVENALDPAQIQGTGAGGRITRNDVLDHIDDRAAGTAPAGPTASSPPPLPPPPPPPPSPGTVTAAPPAAPAPAAPSPPAVPVAPAAPAAPATVPTAALAASAPAAPASAAQADPVPAAPVPAPVPVTKAAVQVGPRDQVVPFTSMRRRTAEHMVRSLDTSAHVTMSMEIDFERVERVRRAAQSEWRAREGFSLTYLPFVSRALVDTIAEYPQVNASIDGDSLVVRSTVNLGIAVDLDFTGLIVPVIKNADGKRLRQIAREIRELAEKARARQLGPDDISGGTYTITNPGPFGTHISTAVINQPQVAILTTDGVKKRPVVVEGPDGDSIAVRHIGYVGQTFDHRAFDGAYSAAFLRRLKEILETRDWETELA